MLTILVSARLVLFGVFLLAGLTKLADRQGSRKALVEFGVPKFLAGPVGVVLPLIELATAISLLFGTTASWGGRGAFCLLLLFSLGISINLARGRKPDCHCFGQLHSSPVGRWTLIRNAILASFAGFVMWQGPHSPVPSALAWLGDLTIAQRVGLLGVVVVLFVLTAQSALLFQILRQQGRLLLRLEALEAGLTTSVVAPGTANRTAASGIGLIVGTRAPSFRLQGLRNEAMTLEALMAAGKPALLLFTNPNCGPCQTLLPEIGRWQREYTSLLTVALVSEGTAEDNHAKNAVHGLSQVLLQRNREVAEAYQAWGTPAAVLVRPDGSIGSPVAQGADAIRTLVAQAVGKVPTLEPAASASTPRNVQNGNEKRLAPRQPVVRIGDPAPPLILADLDGDTVTLTAFRGSNTLLLFWNPTCGFCQQMLNDLRRWEAGPSRNHPKLVLVSTGKVEDNRVMNLRSLVLLDQNSTAGAAFGVNGTPMAILLDAAGRIASDIAVGSQSVLTLLGLKAPLLDD